MGGPEDKLANRTANARLPAGIWALGFVSMFMDISSEMVHALLPVFLSTVLGASAITIGAIEGIGEATASFAKLLSGRVSDGLRRRKGLLIAGYGLAALSKPLFALAPSAAWVLAARFSDRIGKGIRGAPRDALIGDLALPAQRGAAYGLRQSLDTVGAFVGPALAVVLMITLDDDFRTVFWVALVPALIAVAILVFAVVEPDSPDRVVVARTLMQWRDIGQLGLVFWAVVGIATVLTLARFSEAFLILRVRDAGLATAYVPLALVVMNAVYAASAYPMGRLSDRLDRRGLLACGFGVLIVADLVLALGTSLAAVMGGVALWGLHMGMTQGLLAALVADVAPDDLRGTAFGIFHFAGGIAVLMASLLAGTLWELYGPPATFLVAAGLTAIGLTGGVLIASRSERIRDD